MDNSQIAQAIAEGRYRTARAEPDPYNKLVLLDGSKMVEDVRESVVGKGKDRQQVITATLATKSEGGSVNRRPIDISWLPAASKVYRISADIRDYVFVSVPIVTADFPNRNMDCFTLAELTRFSPAYGRPVYQSFIGKSTFADHDNQDPAKSKGVHFDATMREYKVYPGRVGYHSQHTQARDLMKVRILTGWCRQKDEKLVQAILKRERTGYSMGAFLDYAECSVPYCGKVTSGKHSCDHKGHKGKLTRDGYVIYDLIRGVCYFETSNLGEEPADLDAFAPDDVVAPHLRWNPEDVWSTGLEAA